MNDVSTTPGETPGRRDLSHVPGWKGKKLLAVADPTPEGRLALYFAAHRAVATEAHLTLLYVSEPSDFQSWAAVEERMRDEARQEAEAALYDLAAIIRDVMGELPEWVIREGHLFDEIKSLITEDPDIRILVVGAAQGKDGHGPLLSKIAADWGSFPVPITIVPGNLTKDDISMLT